ncbi:MAG: Hpt domain-containing protein [Candidatus Levybacteria bacterium]|nr:Hpt domain-containing protein [Candidatus Levybacteria bacterium]
MTVDLAQFKSLYLTTSREQLADLIQALSKLQENPKEPEAIKEIYMNVHTIASKSNIMGYTNIGTLCRTIEKIFYDIKNGGSQVSSELLDSLLFSFTDLQRAINSIEHEQKEIDLTEAMEKVKIFTIP